MKKYIFLSVIFAVIGFFLCIDTRTLKVIRLSDFEFDHSVDYFDELPDNEQDRKLVECYLTSDFSYEKMLEIRPDDYVWLVQTAWMNDFNTPNFDEIVAKLRKIDPENGCNDYLQAAFYARKAGKLELKGDKREYALLDRKELEKSVYFYQQALKKPHVKFYAFDRPEEIIRIISIRSDTLGTLQRIGLYAKALLPHLTHLRLLASSVTHYAEILDKEGKKAESRQLLASGRNFVQQWAKYNSDTLIENLVYVAIIGIFHESAQKLNDKAMTDLYGKVVDDFTQWKNKKDMTAEIVHKHGGLLSNMLFPVLKTEIPLELLTPERKLTYLVYDRLGLIAFALVCAVIILWLALCAVIGKISGKELEIIKFSRTSWTKIFCIGMLLPMFLFLIYRSFDNISGRGVSLQNNLDGLITGMLLIIFMWVWLAAALRIEIKAAPKVNFASRCLSKILPYAILLLLVGSLIGTYFDLDEIYYCKKDTLFRNAKGFSGIEAKVVKERNEILKKLLK